MPKLAISDATVRSLSVPDKGQRDFWDAHFPGFGVRVSQGGTKTFILNFQNSRRTLGRYGIVSLAEAREHARRILAEKTLGKVRPQAISYQTARTLFLQEKERSKKPRTFTEYKRLLHRLTFHGQLADISHDDVARKLSRVKHPSAHFHVLVALRCFFNWCIKRRYITENPTLGLSARASTPRARVLSDDELRLIWRACEGVTGHESPNPTPQGAQRNIGVPSSFATIVKLLILTGQRRGEIAALQTSWITTTGFTKNTPASGTNGSATDLCTLTLPASVTKNGREHTFPIGTTATLCLDNARAVVERGSSPTQTKTHFLFPARGTENCFNGWSKSKKALDKASGVQNWTLHDLRRTYASNMARIGVPLHVIEKLLNHVSGSFGGIVSVYQRHSFLPEMREAVEKYEVFILDLLRR